MEKLSSGLFGNAKNTNPKGKASCQNPFWRLFFLQKDMVCLGLMRLSELTIRLHTANTTKVASINPKESGMKRLFDTISRLLLSKETRELAENFSNAGITTATANKTGIGFSVCAKEVANSPEFKNLRKNARNLHQTSR